LNNKERQKNNPPYGGFFYDRLLIRFLELTEERLDIALDRVFQAIPAAGKYL